MAVDAINVYLSHPPARRALSSRLLPPPGVVARVEEDGVALLRLVRGPWLISVVLSGRGAAGGGLPFILAPANLSRRGTDRVVEMGLGMETTGVTLDSCAINLF